MSAPFSGKTTRLSTLNMALTTAFAGKMSSCVMPIPITPEIRPSINVSALNTLAMSRLEAPIERRIPIYFLRSRTEMNVMMPIMMLETTSEIDTNAISIAEIMSTISVTELISAPTMSV